MIKKGYLIFYYLIASKLPSSFFPLGSVYNSIRTCSLKKIISLGEHCKIQRNVYIGSGNNISIGGNCQINQNVHLDNVSIGNYVMIAPGVTILGKMHEFKNNDIPMILQGEKECATTQVGDNVWIGTNAIIMPGIKISPGCIIGAGAVVTKDCKKIGVYGGIPARFIKSKT